MSTKNQSWSSVQSTKKQKCWFSIPSNSLSGEREIHYFLIQHRSNAYTKKYDLSVTGPWYGN